MRQVVVDRLPLPNNYCLVFWGEFTVVAALLRAITERLVVPANVRLFSWPATVIAVMITTVAVVIARTLEFSDLVPHLREHLTQFLHLTAWCYCSGSSLGHGSGLCGSCTLRCGDEGARSETTLVLNVVGMFAFLAQGH